MSALAQLFMTRLRRGSAMVNCGGRGTYPASPAPLGLTLHSSLLTPQHHVVAVDDLVEVVVRAQLVGALTADGGELAGRVVGQSRADRHAVRPDQRYNVPCLEESIHAEHADRE